MSKVKQKCCLAAMAGALLAAAAPGYEIAFHDRGGLFRMAPDGTQVRLILSGAMNMLQPNWWSPDGRKILYTTREGVRVANVDGSGDEALPVQLTGLDIQMVWSPDSTRVAFASGFEDPKIDSPEARRTGYSTAIYVVEIATKKRVRVTGLGQNRWMPWSRDGRRIAYAAGTDLDVVSADGGAPRKILASPAMLAAWSPKGDWIAFVGVRGVSVIRPDGSGLQRLGDSGSALRWSPDGRWLLTGTKIVDAGSGAAVDLGPQWMIDAAFAPDGRSIIYRTNDRDKGAIWAVDVDGKNRRKLSDACCSFVVSPLLGK